MLCESCHQKEALVHITEIDGESCDWTAPAVRWHFCEACGTEYQQEFLRHLEHSPSCYHQGMSKQELEQATREHRDQTKRHMAAWVSGKQSE